MPRKRTLARHPGLWPVVPSLAVALLVAGLMAVPSAPGAGATHFRPQDSLTANGNFFLAEPGPHGFVDPGSRLTVQYRVQSTAYPGSSGPGTIRIPASIATFSTSTGSTLHLFLPVNSFSIDGPGSISSIANASLRLSTGETFTMSNATLSSNNFAVQASWNPAQYPVQIQWQWVVVLADGTQTSGPWSPWTSVEPAQLALLSGSPPSSVPIGGVFGACLSGPITDRNFTIHFSTNAPIETFNGPTVTVPSSSGNTYCWNSTLPSNWAPQTVQAHLWEIAATSSYLLYQMPFQLVNGTGIHPPPPPPGGSAAWYSVLITPIWLGWVSPLILLILGALIVVGIGAGARRRSRRAAARRARDADGMTSTSPATDEESI